jgi:hypothetical protein
VVKLWEEADHIHTAPNPSPSSEMIVPLLEGMWLVIMSERSQAVSTVTMQRRSLKNETRQQVQLAAPHEHAWRCSRWLDATVAVTHGISCTLDCSTRHFYKIVWASRAAVPCRAMLVFSKHSLNLPVRARCTAASCMPALIASPSLHPPPAAACRWAGMTAPW